MGCLQLSWLGNKKTSVTPWLFFCQDTTVLTSWHWWASPHVIFSSSLLSFACFPAAAPVLVVLYAVPQMWFVRASLLSIPGWITKRPLHPSSAFTLFRFCTAGHTFHSNFFTVSSCIFPSQFLFLLLHCFSISSQNQTKPLPVPRGEGREGRDRISLKMW